MKVLTIKEPFASLIKDKYKVYETRSWKINYRGGIFINAGLAKINLKDERICKLSKLINVNPGMIVCKAMLSDCILITEDFLKMLSPLEILCGDFTLGRYAWKMTNIELIDPIPVKGKLGLWNYKENI